mmetsp:Transcript_62318/g.129343  ORF Transcript_62318/g.129343 Transcript_62318/m.129343 type:complete len:137 (+) Transcript_62318:882-1292(+)
MEAVEQACYEFRAFMGPEERSGKEGRGGNGARAGGRAEEREMEVQHPSEERHTLGENIVIMKSLQEQFMGMVGFISRLAPDDPSAAFMQAEVSSVQDQISCLRREMQTQQLWNVAAAMHGVARPPVSPYQLNMSAP